MREFNRRLEVRLTEAIYDGLAAEAKERGMATSTLARHLISQSLAKDIVTSDCYKMKANEVNSTNV